MSTFTTMQCPSGSNDKLRCTMSCSKTYPWICTSDVNVERHLVMCIKIIADVNSHSSLYYGGDNEMRRGDSADDLSHVNFDVHFVRDIPSGIDRHSDLLSQLSFVQSFSQSRDFVYSWMRSLIYTHPPVKLLNLPSVSTARGRTSRLSRGDVSNLSFYTVRFYHR